MQLTIAGQLTNLFFHRRKLSGSLAAKELQLVANFICVLLDAGQVVYSGSILETGLKRAPRLKQTVFVGQERQWTKGAKTLYSAEVNCRVGL